LGVAIVALLAPRLAQAVVVEKIVAVVGEKAILLTDLRKRARPFLVQIYAKFPAGPQRAAAESKLFREVIERMVDEELESLAAARSNVTVSSKDVDQAMRNIARLGNMTVEELLQDVRLNAGMSEQQYREEIRRQVLEGKLLHRQLERGARITEQELRTMFEEVRRQERQIRQYRPAWIVLRVGETPDPDKLAERMALAEQLTERARGGEDFAKLAEEHSEEAATKPKGGDLGVRAPVASKAALMGQRPYLDPKLERVIMGLEPGEVADPVRYRDAVVVLKLLSRQPSRYPSFESARAELGQIVQAKRLEKIKGQWLKELRRRTHVEIRL